MPRKNGNPMDVSFGSEREVEGKGETLKSEATRPIEDLLHQLGPRSVFGRPVETGRVTIIPVAEVRTGFGFGLGRGESIMTAAAEGEGYGGGAAGRVIPRGYIRIIGDDVRFEPILDITRLALASMALAGLVTFMVTSLLSRDR